MICFRDRVDLLLGVSEILLCVMKEFQVIHYIFVLIIRIANDTVLCNKYLKNIITLIYF